MSKLVLNTLVENLLNSGRKFTWIEQHGKNIPGNSSIIVEGAYPSACVRRGQASQMQSDLDNGFCKVTIVTDLPVMKPLADRAKTPPPARKAAKKAETAEPILPKDIKINKADRFQKGSIEEIGKPPIAKLPGADDLPKLPEKVEIFSDGGQEIGAEMIEKPEYIKQPAPVASGLVIPEGGEDHLLTKEALAEKKASTQKAPAKKRTTRKRKASAKKVPAKKTGEKD